MMSQEQKIRQNQVYKIEHSYKVLKSKFLKNLLRFTEFAFCGLSKSNYFIQTELSPEKLGINICITSAILLLLKCYCIERISFIDVEVYVRVVMKD